MYLVQSLLKDIQQSIVTLQITRQQLQQIAYKLEQFLSQHKELSKIQAWAEPHKFNEKPLMKSIDPEFYATMLFWGAKSETPLYTSHDTWGVFAVCAGNLEIKNYSGTEIIENDSNIISHVYSSQGDVTYTIPSIHNSYKMINTTDSISVSIHLHGKQVMY